METHSQIQLRTSSGSLPAIPSVESLADVRMDEVHYPHYRNIHVRSRQEWLSNQIKYVASIARIRDYDARESILMASALDEMMIQCRDMADLTLPEIADAFKSGVFGVFGEFYGLSAPNLYGFLSSFLESSKKKEATDVVSNRKVDAYREKMRKENELRQQQIRREIEEAKRNGTFVPTGKVWFQPKMVDQVIDSRAHRELVRQQAREILNATDRKGDYRSPGLPVEDPQGMQ